MYKIPGGLAEKKFMNFLATRRGFFAFSLASDFMKSDSRIIFFQGGRAVTVNMRTVMTVNVITVILYILSVYIAGNGNSLYGFVPVWVVTFRILLCLHD